MLSDDEEQRYWKTRSIYRVPARITALNCQAYRPQVVSFGPYHHGEDHLLPMEEHKCRAVRHFLRRSGKCREHFFESLREVAWDLEESYNALDLKWKAGNGEGAAPLFLELMVTDGCFMLEILRFAADEVHDYAPNDPIFSKHGELYIMPDIRHDMLMLENQLPMLVLDRLVAVESHGEKDDESVNRLIFKSWFHGKDITGMGKCLHVLDVYRKHKLKEPKKKDNVERKYSEEIIRSRLHVLDVFRKHMRKKPKDNVEMKDGMKLIRSASATELSEHGIQFKNSKTRSLNDISFEGGVLRLPTIVVGDKIESVFLNLMAFERFHVGAGNEVTSYICFMDYIIDKGQDVALLRAQGILQNDLESDEAVAKLFNLLAKGATMDSDSSINGVLTKVEQYYSNRWNMWRVNFFHTYFRNPWVTLSLIAAVFLFALTIIQT
ncbi:hypothetical protein EUGRSUZ_J01683, partial [Eucalyptus grandis]